MSTEHAWMVGIPANDANTLLSRDIASAIARSRKSEPGDRFDIARFEALATQLEQSALRDGNAERISVEVPFAAGAAGAATLVFGADRAHWSHDLPGDVEAAATSLIDRGLLPVLVVDPFSPGQTHHLTTGGAEDPAERWESDGEWGRRAVEARFRAQIEEALVPDTHRRSAISPSGIQNPVVTEILREYAAQVNGSTRVDVEVDYRDGSRSANPFPLRALPLRENLPAASLQLRFALLSIRHTEMDAVVDGAWLRNAEISRPRPAAQTDDLVYELSRRQLAELCQGERHVRLYMYQTGLETAVVGFYRALVDHLLEHPRSVSVQPMYFESTSNRPKKAKYAKRNKKLPKSASVVAESSLFRKGTAWTM